MRNRRSATTGSFATPFTPTGHRGTEAQRHRLGFSVFEPRCLGVSVARDRALIRRKRLHRKRPGLPGIDGDRRAAAALAHQRREPRHQRRELLRRRQRTREQRKLEDARRRRIDGHDDAIDGGGGRMRLEIQQRQRAQRARVASWAPAAAASARAPSRVHRDAAARAAPRRRGRAARDAPTADPSAGRARTTAAPAPRSATRDRAPARSAPRARAGSSGRGSSPRASRCHRDALPARAARRRHRTAAARYRRASAGPTFGMSRTSFGVEFGSVRVGAQCDVRVHVREQRRGSGASASASPPGSMTVRPGAPWASSRAAVRVPAMATRTRRSAVGGGAAQLVADRARVAEQVRQAAEIERDLAGTVHLDARRELSATSMRASVEPSSAAYSAPNIQATPFTETGHRGTETPRTKFF